jgi:hypothetical protein
MLPPPSEPRDSASHKSGREGSSGQPANIGHGLGQRRLPFSDAVDSLENPTRYCVIWLSVYCLHRVVMSVVNGTGEQLRQRQIGNQTWIIRICTNGCLKVSLGTLKISRFERGETCLSRNVRLLRINLVRPSEQIQGTIVLTQSLVDLAHRPHRLPFGWVELKSLLKVVQGPAEASLHEPSRETQSRACQEQLPTR